MGLKIFLDANILLDFFLKREKYDLSKELMSEILEGNIRAVVSPSILHILGHWLTKAYGSKKAKELLQTLLLDISVIDCSHSIAEKALCSKIEDIEDALQYYTAIAHKTDYFITEDKKLKKSATEYLPVYDVVEFLKIYHS